MLYLSIATFIFCFLGVQGKNGIDISVATDDNTFKCLINEHNISYAIVRAFRSTGVIDSEAPNTIKSASNNGLSDLSAYIFPCIAQSNYSVEHDIQCPTFKEQIDEVLMLLNNENIYFENQRNLNVNGKNEIYLNKLWIDIEDEVPSKYYANNTQINIAFMQAMVSYMEFLNIPIGIYTTKTYWSNIMNNTEGYGQYPLWYPRYDDINDMSFFEPFADFEKVDIKQTAGDAPFCEISQVDSDYSV